MNLTDLAVRNAKPREKPYKLTDGDGMFLLVQPNGSRYWRFAYRYLGKQKILALGVYPEVGLALARQRRAEAREQLALGADPGETKKAEKRAARVAANNTFEAIALAWLEERRPYVEPRQHERTLARLQADVFPWLGTHPITAIDPPELLAVLKRIDSRGARFTAHRIRSEISRAFMFGIKEGLCTINPAAGLIKAIPPAQTTHFASITDPTKVGEMLRAFDGFSGTFPVLSALRLSPMLFVRPRQAPSGEVGAI